jgi:ribosome maturation factor RimP
MQVLHSVEEEILRGQASPLLLKKPDMIAKKKVEELLETLLSGTDKFPVEVAVQPGNRIAVFIDSDSQISIHDCQEISRAIEKALDREKEDFDLTVSSSGIDRPLTSIRQFRKNLGKEIQVVRNDNTPVSGVLTGVTETAIELEHPVRKPKKEIKKENTVLPLSEIKTAKIIVKFGK